MEKYIWLIADTHFNHPNILKYEDRPSNYQELIIAHWKKLVRPQDTIIHL
jgi:calcineurin-like phosphoesterase family protein